MYIRKNVTLKNMLKWTRKDIYTLVLISSVPVIFYDVLGQQWLHLPWLPIALIGTAVAFVVSFKNNASYDRLWEARKIWGGIVNTSRSFATLVNTYVTNKNVKEINKEELQTIKEILINRHIAWMVAHRYTLRQKKPWENVMKKMIKSRKFKSFFNIEEWNIPFEDAIKPYLSEKEFNQIQGKRSPETQLLSYQSAHLQDLKDRGLIWEFSELEIENQIVELYTLQGKNERIKNFPYPRQYATLNLFFVWIFILLLPFGIMNEFDKIGTGLLENISSEINGISNICYLFIAKHFIWLSIPFSTIVSWIFLTMERIGEASENPFEGTANDIPITSMSRDIEIDMLQIIGVTKVIPERINSENDIVM